MTICGMVVAGIIIVDWPGTIAVGVPVEAGMLVLIVIDGIPVTDAHTLSNARNENA
jgi:hypothetical protein